LVVRLGDGEGRPDPLYGHQLQTHSAPGLSPEGRIERIPSQGPGHPGIAVQFTGGPVSRETRLSYRQAPPIIGRGDLETISEAAILSLADPADSDRDGISGRVHWVNSDEGARIGRYGWKARHADLEGQVAEAFAVDLGLSSPGVPRPHGDCTERQADCLAAPTGVSAAFGGHELSGEMVRLVRDFVASLPAIAPADQPAATIFAAAGCSACHMPQMANAVGEPVYAFTDLLLHDMGAALDDGMGEPGVAPAEWRTAPLIGMAGRDGSRRYLHDGQAATIDEAIRAHGGEAATARTRYEKLSAAERAALLAYLETL